MKTSLLTVLALSSVAAVASAQSAASPIADAMRSTAKRASANLVAAAEELPQDKYGFKPTPAQMSFGEVIGHLIEGNDFLCSSVTGATPPKRAELGTGAPKDKLVARLQETFQFCETSLAKLEDKGLDAKVPFFGNRQVTRAQAMFVTAQDWADHYSQLAIYLRLNGLLPPTAKQKE